MSTSTEAPSLLDACRQVMGHDDVRRALRLVQQARSAARLEPDEPVNDAAAALLAGADVDAITDLGQRLHDRQQRYERHQLHLDGLTLLANRLQDEAHARQQGSADRALVLLRTELARVLDQAAPLVSVLAGVTTADEAVDRDVAAEWKQARKLADRQVEVRHVQAVVMSGLVETRDVTPQSVAPTVRDAPFRSTVELVATFGTVKTFAAMFPGGYVRRAEPVTGTNITQVDARNSAEHTPLPWDTGSPVHDLLWIAQHRDVVWLPSSAELLKAKAQFDQAQAEEWDRQAAVTEQDRQRAVAERLQDARMPRW